MALVMNSRACHLKEGDRSLPEGAGGLPLVALHLKGTVSTLCQGTRGLTIDRTVHSPRGRERSSRMFFEGDKRAFAGQQVLFPGAVCFL